MKRSLFFLLPLLLMPAAFASTATSSLLAADFEPSSLLLICLGLACIVAIRRLEQ